YNRYEISNYAKEGYECKHNLGYWIRVPYLGFGISAASLYKNTRFQMHSDLDKFINKDYSSDTIILTKKDAMEEFMFLGLRCTDGVSKEEFFKEFDIDLNEYYKDEIEKLKKQDLLKEEGDRLFLTDKGLDVANYCMSEFIK
ncbi:MAG: coproporphyrinogen III oxidase, partial [Lachnospiraceae bacterium]|nr:coproporphyrinogen III oxidase [Lachnospiraceae bacterium]